MSWTARRVAWLTFVVAGGLFVVLAAILVPWQPVPGGVPAPVDPETLFTPAEIARAEAYSSRARLLGWSSLAVSLAVFAGLAWTPAGARLVRWVRGPWWVRTAVAVAIVLLVVRLVTLPFSVLAWRWRVEHGLSTQSAWQLAADLARGELLGTSTTALLVVVLVAVARRWKVFWPAVAAVGLAGFVMAASFAYPVAVEPIFNDFEPLPEGALRTGIAQVAQVQGVDIDDVVVADASRRTTTLNAWVSGLGSTRRVVLYDNLVEQVPKEQVMVVVAHELAHAKHEDVVVGTILGAAGAAAATGLLAALLLRRGRQELENGVAIVPLLLALVAIGTQLAAPIENGISRRIELRADTEALNATTDPDGFVAIQRELALKSLSDPSPPGASQWWWGSHPTVLTRVALAEAIRSASAGLDGCVYRGARLDEQSED